MLRSKCLRRDLLRLIARQPERYHVRCYSAASDGDSRPLAGKTIGIKANIVTKDQETTAASRILEGFQSPFDATVVKLLRENGADILAGLNMDEFGMGSHSQDSHHGAVHSPFSRGGKSLSPGGSSGGSAVAVQKQDCWAALGTDTGGSVRLPAAYTGIVGFKPSYGLLSRWGVIQYANSLDTVGILARSVTDAQEIFLTLDQHDPQDPTSLSLSVRQRINETRLAAEARAEASRSLRIGIPLEYNIAEISPAVRETYLSLLQRLHAAGHDLIPVSLPNTRLALSAYYVLAPAEAASNLAKYDGIRYGHRSALPDSGPDPTSSPLYAKTRGEAFGSEVRRRILLGAYTLSASAHENYFRQAQRVRRLVQRDFDAVFAASSPLASSEESNHSVTGTSDKVDILLTPTAPTLPPTLAELAAQPPVARYMNDVFTVPASLAGLPAASVPVPLALARRAEMDERDVSSVGIQVIGQFGQDAAVLRVAKEMEALDVE